ncbi:DUF7384 family protein [Halospeciosus flavus]|uniref:PIN domain-containing protein n=1 Tax=Halospeciosus flavus TaxID=3032283 RepID=A0ABD5Z7V6_9EURY|nr:hypothetical protein [Halospeciosus flavus]
MTDEPDPTRLVADADVLAADLLVGGAARDVLDAVRAHSWLTLVVSDPLLDDAEAVVADLANAELAADWRDAVDALGESVDHPAGDHPALACAYRGEAAHVLTYEEDLLTTKANATLKQFVTTSFKTPDAFATVFDPEQLYPALFDEPYPGPDADPRD